MPQRFFVPSPPEEAMVTIAGAAARHIAASLRMRPGDQISVVDDSAQEHGLHLVAVSSGLVEGRVLWSRPASGEPRLHIEVLQALPRDRMEDCIDALVEVGAAVIRPVVTEHVVSRPLEERIPRRLDRWRSVAMEAAQLSGRARVPPVHPPILLRDAVGALPPGTRIVACTMEAETPLAQLDVDVENPLAVCVGPEGGLGAEDLAVLHDAGAVPVHLGARVLRTRLAGAVVIALMLQRSGDLETPMLSAPTP